MPLPRRAAAAAPWPLVLALLAFSASAGAASAAGPVDFKPSKILKPQGPVMKQFVRIDVAGDAVSPGCAIAVPVLLRPLRVIDPVTAARYTDWWDAVPEGYELKDVHGQWQLFSEDRGRAVPAWECVLGQPQEPLIKAMLRGANPTAYGNLELGDKLHVLGTCAWGIEGNDLSSSLRLPFQVQPSAQVSADFKLLFVNQWTGPDPGVVAVGGAETAMVQRICNMGLTPAVRVYFADAYLVHKYKRQAQSSTGDTESQGSDADIRGLYNNVLGAMFDDFKDDPSPVLKVSFPFTDSLTATISLTACTAGPSTTPAPDLAYRIVYWPKSDSRGFVSNSSFSEPGFGKHRGETWVYLTPLSMVDIGYVALALRRELVRAWRTGWLLRDCVGMERDGVPVAFQPFMQESLLRATLPLWENLAIRNSIQQLSGVNAYTYLAAPARGRLSNNAADALALMIRTPQVETEKLGLDDLHVPSYLKPFDAPADHRYARAVYLGWKNWKETRAPKLRPVVDALGQAIMHGYCRGTGSVDAVSLATSYFNVAATNVTTYFDDAGSPPDRKGLKRFAPRYTDLQWVAQAIAPVVAGGSGPTPLATAAIDACPLSPLAFPFRPLHKLSEGRQLLRLIRDPGMLASITGLPLTTGDRELRILAADLETVNRLRALCTGQLSSAGDLVSTSSNSYSYVTTWVARPPTGKGPADMEARFTSTRIPLATPTEKTEARYFLREHYGNQLRDLFKNPGPFSQLPSGVQVASFRVYKGGPGAKLTRAQVVWQGASATEPVTETVASLFGRATSTVEKFIDHVALGQPYDPGQASSVARKDKFMQSLVKQCFMLPDEVWTQMFMKYAEAGARPENADWTQPQDLFRRVTYAARSMGRSVSFLLAPNNEPWKPQSGGR